MHSARRPRPRRRSSARGARAAASQRVRVGEVERAEPDEVRDAQAAVDGVGDELGPRRPSRTLRASRPTRRRVVMPCALPEREVLGRASSLNVQIALTHAAGVHRGAPQPSVRPRAMLLPPSSCRLMPVTNSDSRLARYTAACATSSATPRRGEVHALVARAAVGGDVGVAAVVEHVAGADRVAADAVVGVVDRDRAGQAVEARLGRDVRGEAPARAFGLAASRR